MTNPTIPTSENSFAGIQEATARKADRERSGITRYEIHPGLQPGSKRLVEVHDDYFGLAVDLMKGTQL